jgi:PII-like signaling protein
VTDGERQGEAVRELAGEQVLLRIFLGDADRVGHRAAWEAILQRLRAEGLAGASVFHGQAGFGASSVIHTGKLLEMSSDLPVLIEVVDARERVEAALARLDDLIRDLGVLITMENVRVIRYEKRSS